MSYTCSLLALAVVFTELGRAIVVFDHGSADCMGWTTWKKNTFKNIKFNHDKFSISKKNVLRGLHCDFKSWKMVTCVYGKIFFVVVDMRKKSKS